MANRGRTELQEWIDQQYANEPKLRERVKELMAEMEIEQQLVALREARRVSQHTLAKVLGVIASRLSPNWRPSHSRRVPWRWRSGCRRGGGPGQSLRGH